MGGTSDAVVAGSALLLDLHDPDAGAVAAEAAVPARSAVAACQVGSGRGVPAAAALLLLPHLRTATGRDEATIATR